MRHLFFLPVFLIALAGPGCGGDGVKTYPVTGKITFSGQPVTSETVMVLFKPDASKGNTSTIEPAGQPDSEGNYTLTSQGQAGAPAGWYKVVVTGYAAGPIHPKKVHSKEPVTKPLLPAKYGTAKTTDLAVEVVSNPAPGVYDLQLRK